MLNSARTNRRSESRYYSGFGKQITWRRDGATSRRRKAWLNDQSRSGLSLLIDSPRAPQVGADIEVYGRADGDKHLYPVVRIQPMDRQLMLIGCQRQAGDRERASLPIDQGGLVIAVPTGSAAA